MVADLSKEGTNQDGGGRPLMRRHKRGISSACQTSDGKESTSRLLDQDLITVTASSIKAGPATGSSRSCRPAPRTASIQTPPRQQERLLGNDEEETEEGGQRRRRRQQPQGDDDAVSIHNLLRMVALQDEEIRVLTRVVEDEKQRADDLEDRLAETRASAASREEEAISAACLAEEKERLRLRWVEAEKQVMDLRRQLAAQKQWAGMQVLADQMRWEVVEDKMRLAEEVERLTERNSVLEEEARVLRTRGDEEKETLRRALAGARGQVQELVAWRREQEEAAEKRLRQEVEAAARREAELRSVVEEERMRTRELEQQLRDRPSLEGLGDWGGQARQVLRQEAAAREAMLVEVAAQCRAMEEEREGLVAQSQRREAAWEEEREEMQARIGVLESANDRLESANSDLATALEVFKQELEQARSEVRRAAAVVVEQEGRMREGVRVVEEVKALHVQLAGLERELGEAKEAAQVVEEEKAQAVARAAAAEEGEAELREQLRRRAEEGRSLQRAAEEAKARMLRAEEERDAWLLQLERTRQGQAMAEEEEVERLRAELRAADLREAGLREERRTSGVEAEAWRRRLEAVEAERDELLRRLEEAASGDEEQTRELAVQAFPPPQASMGSDGGERSSPRHGRSLESAEEQDGWASASDRVEGEAALREWMRAAEEAAVEVQSLREELVGRQRAVAVLEAKCAEQEELVVGLEERRASETAVLMRKLQEVMRSREREGEEAQAEAERLRRAVEGLRRQVREAEEQGRDRVEELRGEVEEMRAMEEEARAGLLGRVREVEAQLGRAVAERDQACCELDALRDSLDEQARHWQERLEAAVRHATVWEKERREAGEREAGLRRQVAVLEQQLHQASLLASGEEDEEAQLERRGKEEVVEALRARLITVEEELARASDGLEAEREEGRAVVAQLEAAKEAAVEALRTRLVCVEEELARARDGLEAEREEARAVVAQLETEKEAAVEALRARLICLEEELEAEREAGWAVAARLEAEEDEAVEVLRARLVYVEEELARARDGLEAAREEGRAVVAQLEAEKAAAVEALRTRLVCVEEELVRARDGLEAAREEGRDVVARLEAEKAAAVEALRTRLVCMEEELEAEREAGRAVAARLEAEEDEAVEALRARLVCAEEELARARDGFEAEREVRLKVQRDWEEEARRLADEYSEQAEVLQADLEGATRRAEAAGEAWRRSEERAEVLRAELKEAEGLGEKLRASEEMVAWLQKELEGITFRAQEVDVEELRRRLEREEEMVTWLREECLLSKQEAWRRAGGEAEARRRLKEERARIDTEIERMRAGQEPCHDGEGGVVEGEEEAGGAVEQGEEGDGGMEALRGGEEGSVSFVDAVGVHDGEEEEEEEEEGEEEEDDMSLWSQGPLRELQEYHRMEKAAMLEGFIEELETVRVEAQAVIDAERGRGLAACRIMMAVQGRVMRRARRLDREAEAWRRWRAAVVGQRLARLEDGSSCVIEV